MTDRAEKVFEDDVYNSGYNSGYHARDAEIEQLKWCSCGDAVENPRCPNCAMLDNIHVDAADVVEGLQAEIKRLKAGIEKVKSHAEIIGRCKALRGAKSFARTIAAECDELLKGGGDDTSKI